MVPEGNAGRESERETERERRPAENGRQPDRSADRQFVDDNEEQRDEENRSIPWSLGQPADKPEQNGARRVKHGSLARAPLRFVPFR